MVTISPLLKQIYASLSISCLFLANGYITGLQSIMIPELRSNTSELHLSLDQESWIMSLPLVIMLPSQLLSGYLTYKFGRRLIMIFSAIPITVTLILMKSFLSYESLVAGSLLFGLSGAGFSTGPMYIAEVASPKYRNVLLNTRMFGMLIGMLTVHLCGGWFHWKDIIPYGFISIVIGIITSATSPESPTWLASKGRIEECRKSFKWFRGNNDQDELEKLIESKKTISSETLDTKNKVEGKSQFKQTVTNLTDKAFIKAMGLCVACIMFVDMNGKQIFNFYFLDAFSSIISDKKYAYYLVAGIDMINLVTTSLAFVTARKFDMRPLLFKTGFSALFTILLFSLTSYLFMNNIIPSRFRWITLVFVIIYLTLLNVGVVPTLLCILNEVIPFSHRELGMSISSFIFVAILFFTIKFTPYSLKYLDLPGTFLITVVILSIALLHLYFNLPETRNRTLQDIEMEMSGKSIAEDKTAAMNIETAEALIKSDSTVTVKFK